MELINAVHEARIGISRHGIGHEIRLFDQAWDGSGCRQDCARAK
jgi:hypothetical protein